MAQQTNTGAVGSLREDHLRIEARDERLDADIMGDIAGGDPNGEIGTEDAAGSRQNGQRQTGNDPLCPAHTPLPQTVTWRRGHVLRDRGPFSIKHPLNQASACRILPRVSGSAKAAMKNTPSAATAKMAI